MATGKAYRGVYTYAWDLIDEGFATVAGSIRDLGCNTVTLAASYHAGKFMRPHGEEGRVYFPEDGTVYFRARPERYGRIRPLPNAMLADLDPFAELARVAPDLGRTAWVVGLHNTAQGRLHPDLVARNCFGDAYPYSLCPAHPEVRRYLVALCQDLALLHAPEALVIETPGWLPCDHGFHHEFALLPLNGWVKVLLGLCFAPATVEAARAAGIDAARLAAQAAAWIDGWLRSDLGIDEAMAKEWLLGDLVADPEWAAFLHWRCRLVADLVREVRDAVPRATEVRVIPSVRRPTAGAWIEGSDLRLLAEAADGLEICAYETSALRVAADIADVRRRVGAGARLNAILRPSWPDLADGAETEAAALALKAAGVEGIAFYNWGHLRKPSLARIGAAVRAWEAAP
jgi:hypothetical protein